MTRSRDLTQEDDEGMVVIADGFVEACGLLLGLAPGGWIAGCAVRCEPTGRIFWSGVLPRAVPNAFAVVDGAMGGIRCEAGWQR